jgi:Protein of unknown function (DUF3443)
VNSRQRVSAWLGGRWWALVLAVGLLVLLGCGGGSSSNDGPSPNSGSAPSGGSPAAPITGPNTQPITVNTAFADAVINTLLTSVTLWVTADVGLAEEKALSVPIQLIASPSFATPPVACTRSGLPLQDTPQELHANGILGVGLFVEDCAACDPQHNPRAAVAPPAIYFSCPSVSGTFLCMPTAVPLPDQVQNPVWLLPQDNNGVLIALLPIAPGGAASVVGTLVFGIGTAANNGLGSAQVYTTDALGHFTTTFAGTAYPTSYLDTGSNLLFILDATRLGLPLCGANTEAAGAYCPATPVSFTATTTGANGVTGTVTFSIANATTLLSSPNVAFNDLATPFTSSPEAFAWGLPFFFGRTVFVAIQGQSTPDGPGPYWAY